MKTVRSLRLISGLVLFTFVIMHLINHAFGLASIETMEQARKVLLLPWANPIGGIVIMTCMAIHVSLGLLALYLRPTLRLGVFDSFQLLLGLCIPLFLLPHLIVMLLGPFLLDERLAYETVLTAYWVDDPWLGLRMVLGVMAVWIHGCMGLFSWMRVQAWWARVAPLVYPIIVLVPVLALLGFVEAGKELIDTSDPGSESAYSSDTANDAYSSNAQSSKAYSGDTYSVDAYGNEQQSDDTSKYDEQFFVTLIDRVMLAIIGLLALILLARYLRVRKNTDEVIVRYAAGRSATAPVGVSLLEISRFNNITHGSLCGGKGRCGTCQVRIISGHDLLPPKNKIETELLIQLRAADDVRLACQTRPAAGEIRLQRLIPRPANSYDARALANGQADLLAKADPELEPAS